MDRIYLVTRKDQTIDLSALSSDCVSVAWSSGICVTYRISTTKHDKERVYSLLRSYSFEKLMESYWFPCAEEGVDRDLLRVFFDYMAPVYSNLIDCDRNVGCYRYLLKIAFMQSNSSSPPRDILDFGSGPGMIDKALPKTGYFRISHYDISREMLALGSEDCTKTQQDLISESQDIVISSYVFHFGVSLADIRFIERILRPGGVWVLNFHKNIYLNVFLLFITNVERMNCSHILSTAKYGTVVCLRNLI